ncbi:MAG: hypothetical protein ACM336_00705 [Acidobacteriota bacterium]
MLTYIERHRPARISEIEFGELLCALAPVSEAHLRRLLRDTGVPLAPLVEGIRQDSFENLERTLREMLAEYAGAVQSGNAPRAKACRAAVIAAKDHARFALRRPALDAAARAAKEEMVMWMLTWLENPGVFPAWLELRKRAVGQAAKPAAGC